MFRLGPKQDYCYHLNNTHTIWFTIAHHHHICDCHPGVGNEEYNHNILYTVNQFLITLFPYDSLE